MKKGVILIGIILATMMMFSNNIFAGGGWGGRGPCAGAGYADGGPDNCPGYGGGKQGRGWAAGDNLSEEDAQKLQEKRDSFRQDTADLRQSINQKRLEMRAEMAKPDPDAAKLSELQKEISGLNADFAQKRLTHRLEMKKLLPEDYRAGAGMGRGRGWGRGPGYGGGCWK